jgi:hypothetical protein
MQGRSIWLIAGIVILACIAIYLEFVIDFRTPRSSLAMRGALVTSNKVPPETLATVTASLKAKYGEAAKVWQSGAGINATLNGKIVATEPAQTFFFEASGVTQVADEVGVISTFPFSVSPYEVRDSLPSRLVAMIKIGVGPIFPPGSLDFDQYDFSIEQCQARSARKLGLGLANWILDLNNSTICTVVRKDALSRRLLVGVVVSNGGRWVRLFVRGVCRMLSYAWLASAQRANSEQRPDYAQCILVDDPENEPFGSGISSVAYEIRKDSSLAVFGSEPRVIILAPLMPDPRIPTFHRVHRNTQR